MDGFLFAVNQQRRHPESPTTTATTHETHGNREYRRTKIIRSKRKGKEQIEKHCNFFVHTRGVTEKENKSTTTMEAYGSNDANKQRHTATSVRSCCLHTYERREKKATKKKLTLQLFLGARLNLNILTSAAVEMHFMLSTRQYAIKCTTHGPSMWTYTHTPTGCIRRKSVCASQKEIECFCRCCCRFFFSSTPIRYVKCICIGLYCPSGLKSDEMFV